MPITSTRVDTEREGARTSAQGMDGLRGEVTVFAEQMGALGSAVSPDAWCGACADAFRGHVAELAHNASSLALGYDDVGIALRGHARALDALYEDVKDAEKEHRRIGERCGAAMMPAVAARQLTDKIDEVGSTLALKAARREGSPAERATARRAYTAALREVRGLRKDVGKLPWQPAGWLRRANIPLGELSERLDRIPGVRALPFVSVVLAAASTGRDAEELGLPHAAAKNATSLGAGAGVAWSITAGAAAVGVVGLAPVMAGVLVGGVVAAGVGHTVQEYGDDVVEAAGDALDAAGDALGGVKDGLTGLFS